MNIQRVLRKNIAASVIHEFIADHISLFQTVNVQAIYNSAPFLTTPFNTIIKSLQRDEPES